MFRSLVVTAMLALGVAPRSAAAQAFTTRDSAGTRIATSTASTRTGTPVIRMDSTGQVVIGNRTQPPYQLASIAGTREYSSDGRARRIIRRSWTPPRVIQADIGRYVVEWGKRWIKSGGAAADSEYADLRDDPYATTVPAFSEIIADRSGRLWVRTPPLEDAPGNGELNTVALVPSVWSVFDREGRWLDDVTLPARFNPQEIRSDYMLGVARDANGKQTVVRYRLRG